MRRWMTTPPSMLLVDTPVGDALRFMESRGLAHLAVLGTRGIEGLVTREDLRIAVSKGDGWAPRRQLELGAVASPCLSVSPSETLERAVQLLVERGAPALAVVDGGRLAGILSVGDALRALATILGSPEAGARVVVRVPAEADLLDEVRRRSCGLAVRGLAAFEEPGGEMQVILRLRGRTSAA
ncbi:MAG TPA: CBS domain-containing protein [Planctomycetota bacterium]